MFSEKQKRRLLNKLGQKQSLGWFEELGGGEPVHRYLRSLLKDEDLTEHQISNILHGLLRIRMYFEQVDDFLELLELHMNHPSIKVRSEATGLFIGLLKVESGQLSQERVLKARQRLLRMNEGEIYKPVWELLRHYLTEPRYNALYE